MEEYSKEENNSISTTRVGLKYGLFGGLALVIYSLLVYLLKLEGNFLIEMLSYVILVSAIVIGINEYKRYQNGYATYGQGLGLGLIVSTISAIFLATFQSLTIYFNPALSEEMHNMAMEQYQKQNIPQEQIDAMMPFIDAMFSPGGIFILVIITYFILGLILSLIIAAVTRKNPPIFE